MKILVLKPYIMALTNGAELCLLERLQWMTQIGLDVHIEHLIPLEWKETTIHNLKTLGTPLVGDLFEIEGLKARVHFMDDIHPEEPSSFAKYDEYWEALCGSSKPEWIWSHYTDFPSTAWALRHHSHKAWIDISDNEYPRLEKLKEFPILYQAYQNLRLPVVASPFMQRKVTHDFPKAEVTILPNLLSKISINKISRDPQEWIFVNPTQVKGIEFLLELAEKSSDQQFRIIGNWQNEQKADLPPNISFSPRMRSLENVWAKAKGLLMPSIWEEAFGRLPLEAMAYGVPVMASNRGALPETLSEGGMALPLDIDLWNKALYETTEFWKPRIEKGYQRFESYQAETRRIYEDFRKAYFC